MRIEVQNHNDELTVGDKTYNRYYTVKFTVDKAGDGQTFEHVATEYYAGAVNGFGGINAGGTSSSRAFKNHSDCRYSKPCGL